MMEANRKIIKNKAGSGLNLTKLLNHMCKKKILQENNIYRYKIAYKPENEVFLNVSGRKFARGTGINSV